MSYDDLEHSRNDGAPVELFEFTMGATVWRYTSADKPFSFMGNTYAPEPMARGSIEQNQESNSQQLEIRLPIGNPISQMLLADTPIKPVYVTMYRFHRAAPGDVVQAFPGEVLSPSFDFDGACAVLPCMPLTAAFERRVPNTIWAPHCQKTTYSADCGVDKNAFKTTATVSAVTGSTIVSATFATKPDQWFRAGWVQLASGEVRFVEDHVGNTLTLRKPFSALSPGTSVDAYAGDDHLETTCDLKFSNHPQFLGHPDIPTRNDYHGAIV